MNQDTPNLGNVVDLTPHIPQAIIKPPAPVRSEPEHPMLNLSDYQKELLGEISKRPELMKLLKIIFQEYPEIILKEYRQNSPHASSKQMLIGRKTTQNRLKLEAWVEEQLVKAFGIDINKIAVNNLDKKETQPEEINEFLDEEAQMIADVKQAVKKAAKKKKKVVRKKK